MTGSIGRMIAAVRDDTMLAQALTTPIQTIFLLGGNPVSLPERVSKCREAGKSVYIHADLMEGFSRDAAGIRWLAAIAAPTGILTTHAPLVRSARDAGLKTVLRLFLVDSSSVSTGEKLVHTAAPDYVEVMPGLVVRAIAALKSRIDRPLIAGGMLATAKDVHAAWAAGAIAVSTSEQILWKEMEG